MANRTINDRLLLPLRAEAGRRRGMRGITTLWIGGASLLCMVCTSCADLTEVAKFAASAKSACSGYSDIVKDLAASATRSAAYSDDAAKPDALKDAQKFKDEQAAMLTAQKPLTDYIAALTAISTDSTSSAKGKAAGKGDAATGGDSGTDASEKGASGASASAKDASSKDDAASTESDADPTAGDLEKLGMKSTEATAAVGLAKTVAGAITAGYRSDKAAKAIHDANADLQTYLLGLEHIVGTDYRGVLRIEKDTAKKYYSNVSYKYGATEPLAVMLTKQQEQQVLDAIEKRDQAALAYVKILTDIGSGHQKLYDAGEKMSTIKMASIVEPYVSDIYTQSMKVAKAF
jgi:hypothetical protein